MNATGTMHASGRMHATDRIHSTTYRIYDTLRIHAGRMHGLERFHTTSRIHAIATGSMHAGRTNTRYRKNAQGTGRMH